MKLGFGATLFCVELPVVCALAFALAGCRSTRDWKDDADQVAARHLKNAQEAIHAQKEAVEVESAADTLRRRLIVDQKLPTAAVESLGVRDLKDGGQWVQSRLLGKAAEYAETYKTDGRLDISLIDALCIAAGNNRDFKEHQESLFQTALALDLEENEFRSTFSGMVSGEVGTYKSDGGDRVSATGGTSSLSVSRKFKNGVELMSSLSVDLVKMLTSHHGSSFGIQYDGSITIPLLRGSGEFVVAEPLTQAQRNLVYKVREYEQYKRDLVVTIATSYLNVLRSAQTVENQEQNYKRVVTSTRRTRRMADAGLLPEYQFDQTIQNELSARVSWVSAKQSYENSLEAFRILLGVSPDAQVFPKTEELSKLVTDSVNLAKNVIMADYTGVVPDADAPVDLVEPSRKRSGPNEIDPQKAIDLAFKHRPDLQNMREKVEDAQRAVLIAEDALRAELTLGGSAAIGDGRSLYSGDMDDGSFRPSHGTYTGILKMNLPFERTRERNSYRNTLISLEQCVRAYQAKEDSVKQDVYSSLRSLLEHRESVIIQFQAVNLAERRVKSTDLLLQAGRAELRDLLDAQNALLSAQNSLCSAVVSYRLDELKLQRTLGVLEVTGRGVWKEWNLTQYK